MRHSIKASLLAISFAAVPALAQTESHEQVQTVSQPGKATRTGTVFASANVIAIDKNTRTLTLQRANGEIFNIVAGNEVRNFDQIKINDTVNAEYVRSLTLELKKAGTAIETGESNFAARAKPGEKPGMVVGGSVTAVADVVDVNREKKTISLKGPKGNIVELDVKNPAQFDAVKKGDKVEVTYTEAMAVSVEPAAKK